MKCNTECFLLSVISTKALALNCNIFFLLTVILGVMACQKLISGKRPLAVSGLWNVSYTHSPRKISLTWSRGIKCTKIAE